MPMTTASYEWSRRTCSLRDASAHPRGARSLPRRRCWALSSGTMASAPEVRAARIPAPLRPYLRAVTDYDMALPRAGEHLGAPGLEVIFVIPLHDQLEVSWQTQPATRHRLQSCLSGLSTQAAVIHHPARQRGVQLSLTVAGARALIGRSCADLAGELLDLNQAWPAMADLPERLHDVDDAGHRLALVLQRLLRITPAVPAPRASPVHHALSLLERGTPVEQAATAVGYSRRRLSTLVLAESGVSPKEYSRIARFHRARAELARTAGAGNVDLAGLSVRHGFVDQPHLTREWSVMTGLSPMAWLRHEFPYLQYGRAVGQPG